MTSSPRRRQQSRLTEYRKHTRMRQPPLEKRHLLQLAAIVSSSEDAIIGKTLDGLVTSWNSGAERMFGYSAEEMIGHSIERIIHPDFSNETQRIADAMQQNAGVSHFESLRIHRDGHHIYVSLSVSPIKDLEGRIVGISSISRDVTRQKKAEQALRESEERFRSMANTAPVLMWISDAHKNAEWFSQQWYELTGWPHDGNASAHWKASVHPEDVARCQAEYASAFDARMPLRMEYRLRDAAGNYRWLLDIGKPRFQDDGVFVGYIGTGMDVTVQKEAEATLQQRETQYRLMAEAIPQIVWTAQADGYNDYFNKRWFEYTGLTAEETYSGSKSVVHPDDQQDYKIRWQQAIETGKEYEAEYRFRRAADGMYRWHLGRAIPVHDSKGAIVKWFGTCTDIHDQKRAEEKIRTLNQDLEQKVKERTVQLENEVTERKALEQQERAHAERLRNMISNMELAAVAADENLTILHANQQFCDLFGLGKVSDIIGSNGIEVIKKAAATIENGAFFAQALTNIMQRHEKSLNREIPLKDGRILSSDYIPISEGGQHRGHLLLYRDITNEKRIDVTKSEFMSLASHQLRTPLTAIRWMLGRLERSLDKKANDYEKRLLNEGKGAIGRMADTINTMLMISRIESGKVTIKPVAIDLRVFLQSIQEGYRKEYSERHQTFTLDCAPGLTLSTDEGFLREIIQNLVSNAIKYTPENKSVSLSAYTRNAKTVIEVADSGFGIPTHEQEKIFTKFFRATNIVSHETNGTGLGLYLVQLLTKMLGGTIAFFSQENAGTTFTLTFDCQKN